ncbi:ABC transporter transmembrane domain-containing protein [Niveispirillum fermenti]|uniref:ABC transporter transmembrane domain-containing protein n=1 Tax=Niveispirillum fermenti TaxID=1233113 RepID=UPI003A890933
MSKHFTGGLIAVVLDGVMAIATLAVMLVYAPVLTAIVLVGLVLYFGVRALSYPYQRRLTDEGIQLAAKENSIFLETVRGARAFKLFGREAERHSLWQNAWADSINNSLRSQRFGLFGGTANGLFNLAEALLVLWLGARALSPAVDPVPGRGDGQPGRTGGTCRDGGGAPPACHPHRGRPPPRRHRRGDARLYRGGRGRQ